MAVIVDYLAITMYSKLESVHSNAPPTKYALSPLVLVATPRNAETTIATSANEPIPIRLGMTPPFD